MDLMEVICSQIGALQWVAENVKFKVERHLFVRYVVKEHRRVPYRWPVVLGKDL